MGNAQAVFDKETLRQLRKELQAQQLSINAHSQRLNELSGDMREAKSIFGNIESVMTDLIQLADVQNQRINELEEAVANCSRTGSQGPQGAQGTASGDSDEEQA